MEGWITPTVPVPGCARAARSSDPATLAPKPRAESRTAPGTSARGEPANPRHDGAGVEPAVGRQRRDGQPAERPRDGAVGEKRIVQPAQEDDEEDGAGEPAVGEGVARRAREGAAESRAEPYPGEEPPVRPGEGERSEHPRGDEQRDAQAD